MTLARKIAATCALTMATGLLHAAPVELKYTTTLASTVDVPGLGPGDLVTITLLADNGGVGLNSQSWRVSDIVSGSLSAGSYWQSYTDGWFSDPSWLAFATDASGNLVQSTFYGTNSSINHKDSFGVGGYVYLFNGAFRDYFGNMAFQTHSLSDVSRWAIEEVVPVSEPGVVGLLALGLMGVGASRRRAKA